jgi:hypothetical protein
MLLGAVVLVEGVLKSANVELKDKCTEISTINQVNQLINQLTKSDKLGSYKKIPAID